METWSSLGQMGILMETISGGIISGNERCFIEEYLPGPEYGILWPESEIDRISERISDFYTNVRCEERLPDGLPLWSQETLASLRIALEHAPQPRSKLILFIVMEVHWSHHALSQE